MTRPLLSLVVLGTLLGCNRAGKQAAAPASGTTGAAPPAPAAAPAPPSASITNRFGMTFKLVSVEPKPAGLGETGKFGLAFPKQSYYLGQAEVTNEQFMAFEKAARERDGPVNSDKRKYYAHLNEWNNARNLGIELSQLDTDYDYRLPTREEWSFACLNGYDQDCPQPFPDGPIIKVRPDRRPNKYGIEGLTNYDLECGNLEGLHFGLSGFRPPPDELACPCAHYGYGNPEGDDGLNDSIYARYVLMPKAK